jgi:hypothetical protein
MKITAPDEAWCFGLIVTQRGLVRSQEAQPCLVGERYHNRLAWESMNIPGSMWYGLVEDLKEEMAKYLLSYAEHIRS